MRPKTDTKNKTMDNDGRSLAKRDARYLPKLKFLSADKLDMIRYCKYPDITKKTSTPMYPFGNTF